MKKSFLSPTIFLGRLLAIFMLFIVLLAFVGCGFYLRGSHIKPDRLKKLQHMHLIGFSEPLHRAFIDAKGTQGNVIDNRSSNHPALTLKINNETISRTESITDQTLLNKEIQLLYRLRYQLISDQNVVLIKDGRLEQRAQNSFNETERLSSETSLAKTTKSLYRTMAQSLLQVTLDNLSSKP